LQELVPDEEEEGDEDAGNTHHFNLELVSEIKFYHS
jgi:hypothetical protein